MLMMRQPELSRAEWHAVAIALHDAERPAPRIGGFARLGRMLTGVAARQPLADGRLEAIRAFVCETRRRGSASERQAAALAEEGFSPMQITALSLLAQ